MSGLPAPIPQSLKENFRFPKIGGEIIPWNPAQNLFYLLLIQTFANRVKKSDKLLSSPKKLVFCSIPKGIYDSVFIPLIFMFLGLLIHGQLLDVTALFTFGAGLVAFFFVIVCILIFIFVYDNLRRQKTTTATTTT